MPENVILNGRLLPYEEARIAPFDAGFMHGAGLFETMRSRGGKVPLLPEHLARLGASAAALGMHVHLDPGVIADCIEQLLGVENINEARVRLTVTTGDAGSAARQRDDPACTVLLSAAALAPYAPGLYEKGMTVVISHWRQNPRQPTTGHKTLSYMDRLVALRQAHATGAGEALWFTAGENSLAEGCISNVFLVSAQGALLTPPFLYPGQTGLRLCLPGITREIVLKIAAEKNMDRQERILTIDDLLAAREVFLTNAIMGVMPVVRIERHTIGDEQPGPVTRRIMELCADYFAERSDEKK